MRLVDPRDLPITENDPDGIDQEYLQQMCDALPEWQQNLMVTGYKDQFDAVPSYCNENVEAWRNEVTR